MPCLLTVSPRGARALERSLSTDRLQPQLRWILVITIGVALWPVYSRGLGTVTATASLLEPALALAWGVGAACAIGAAWQAKFHRLAALILTGGAGLVTCLTFVWFSAPDLALTQLLVEIVTAVLLLLGLALAAQARAVRVDVGRRARRASAQIARSGHRARGRDAVSPRSPMR